MPTVNPNLKYLANNYKSKRGVVLAGSSRSGKTYSSLHFIIYLCCNVLEKGTINIVKETYNSFKTTLYDDFNRILPDFGLYSPFDDKKEVFSFKIHGVKINLLGADKPSKFHGASCDYLYINEALDVSQEVFDQAEMRCRKFWWMDYNPKYIDHWIYDCVLKRPDVGFLRTTFFENPFISPEEKNKILSYDPNNPENVKAGTASKYNYEVYYKGMPAAHEGVIYRDINYINEWPIDVAPIYGLDFGFVSDPSALVKTGETKTDIYWELLMYESTERASLINDYMKAIKLNKSIIIIADSSDKYTGENKGTVEMVRELAEMGWDISKVSKKKGNVYWINRINGKRINVIINDLTKHVKKEQASYRWKTINGKPIDQPEDGNDHFFDAGKYGIIGLNSNSYSPII